jgi:hypothetical protein
MDGKAEGIRNIPEPDAYRIATARQTIHHEWKQFHNWFRNMELLILAWNQF